MDDLKYQQEFSDFYAELAKFLNGKDGAIGIQAMAMAISSVICQGPGTWNDKKKIVMATTESIKETFNILRTKKTIEENVMKDIHKQNNEDIDNAGD